MFWFFMISGIGFSLYSLIGYLTNNNLYYLITSIIASTLYLLALVFDFSLSSSLRKDKKDGKF